MSNYMNDCEEEKKKAQAKIKDPSKLKMYIVVKDSVSVGLAMTAVGHAVLACYDEYCFDPIMSLWFDKSFKKVVCKVNDEEFDTLKSYSSNKIVTESSLQGAETAMAFCPRAWWPDQFKELELYK